MWILDCIFDVVYYYDFFQGKCQGIFYLGWNLCSCNCNCGCDTGKTEEKVGRRKAFRQEGEPCAGVLFVVKKGKVSRDVTAKEGKKWYDGNRRESVVEWC